MFMWSEFTKGIHFCFSIYENHRQHSLKNLFYIPNWWLSGIMEPPINLLFYKHPHSYIYEKCICIFALYRWIFELQPFLLLKKKCRILTMLLVQNALSYNFYSSFYEFLKFIYTFCPLSIKNLEACLLCRDKSSYMSTVFSIVSLQLLQLKITDQIFCRILSQL